MEKSCRKCAQKLAPDPFLIMLNKPKPRLHAGNSFELSFKKKLSLFFLLNPVPFDEQSY